MNIDLAKLNSATKYPSIETYHKLDPKDGNLLEDPMTFNGPVTLTEKVDGTNARVIVMPDGDWFIGSREELLTARGDRVPNPTLDIVGTLEILVKSGGVTDSLNYIKVYYLEVFGGGIGQGAKQYTSNKHLRDYRLFDMAFMPPDILDLSRERIASWRDHGGQEWASEGTLKYVSDNSVIPLTPRLGTIDSTELPTEIQETYQWLNNVLPRTGAALDETAKGKGEGVVLRTHNREVIAKAKFQDYERTLRRRK